jgi:hypothetical protein
VPFLDCQWSTIWICSCGGGDCGRSNYLEFIRDCLGFVLQECPLHFTCRVACIESCGITLRSISIFLFNGLQCQTELNSRNKDSCLTVWLDA